MDYYPIRGCVEVLLVSSDKDKLCPVGLLDSYADLTFLSFTHLWSYSVSEHNIIVILNGLFLEEGRCDMVMKILY